MQSIPEGHNHRTRIEDEFKNLLPKWTRRVACQNECRPPESCSCRREIVHVHALEAWWNKPASDGVKETKAHYFLEEMGPSSHRIFPLKHQKLFTGEQSCLRVISLLIAQNRSHLIDSFYGADMNDRYLVRSESYLNLREKLLEIKTLKQEQVNGIVEDFHKDKWAYCPMNLTLDMDANLHGTQVIPPFCYKIRLGDKGGTASIYWVAVQKDLISDEALACALQKSLYYDEYYGECYQMVLKSYCGNKRADFELEKHAFSGLDSREDVPIVQYLGSYTHDYGEGQNMGKTYNLLLEYGEWDLYQAWADETNVPPVRAREILRTWDSVFEIAKAIRHVHHPVLPRGGTSEPLRFHGWHADIKPDNILSIRGKLKLADFGFSSFAPAMEGEDRSVPTKLIRGFTDTYGAPELYRMKGPDGSLSGVPQTIDMWSFGCVLSVTATWIVLGFQGVKQYEQVRQFSPANRKYEDPSDRFHDGSDVLPEIRKWHDFLRGHLRPSDTTTSEVLTLIENNLLKANSEDRPDSGELCKMLERVHNVAESQIANLPKHSKEADDVVLRALAEMEKRAQNQKPQDTKAKSNRLQLAIPSVGISQVNPRQRASMQFQKKEVIKSKPLGQTAYRQEILKEELGTSDTGLSVTNPPFQGHPKFIEQIASTVPPFMNRQSVPQLPSTSRPYTPESMVTESNTPTKHQAWTRIVAQSGIPKLEISAPEDSILGDRQVDEPASATASQTNISPSSELTIQLEPIDSKIAKGYMESYPDKFPDGKQAVGERSTTPLESRDSVDLPSSILDLPYNICAKRKALDMEKSKGIWKFAGKMGVGKMGVETRKQDSSLAGTFSDHHELVFVIDNGCTMFGHWPILTFVIETLALNAAGIDKSGIDLRFTVDGYMHDKQRLKGDSGRQVLKKSLKDAWPERHQGGNTTTDMTPILQSIYKNWNRENRPATTLYVFTDGMWTHKDPSALHKAILDFARLDKRMTGKRHFSIQFIRFGDNEQAKEQLQYFDDTLCKKNGLRDIIDHCSWRAPVNKIFKGSIEGFHDEHEDDDPPVVYDYKALVEKFNRFNNGKESSEERSQESTRTGLKPFSSRSRSTSQFSSQASLNMLPRNRDSFATDMSISHSKRNSRGPSFFP